MQIVPPGSPRKKSDPCNCETVPIGLLETAKKQRRAKSCQNLPKRAKKWQKTTKKWPKLTVPGRQVAFFEEDMAFAERSQISEAVKL